MTYFDKLKDPRWQRKRLEILERDNFTCLDCGATDKTLHVHHCHYGKDPWNSQNVLMTLCQSCHESRGELESDAKLALARIMAKLPHEPGNQEDLQSFVQQLVNATQRDDFSPALMDSGDFDFESDIRWFHYACDHPEARKCYEEVTGYKHNWRRFEEILNEQPA